MRQSQDDLDVISVARRVRIHSTPAAERPRERCLRQGARCLSLRECLALVLNSGPPGTGCLGLALEILERPGTGLDDASQERAFFTAMEVSAAAHLEGIPGLGPAGRARLMAAFELGRRYALFREERAAPPAFPGGVRDFKSESLARVPPTLRSEAQEWLGFIPCYSGGKLGSLCLVERGVRTHVNVEPGELFARVLALRPHGIILFHNHPSGELAASDADRDLTHRVFLLGRSLGIRLLGHWIVASKGETWVEAQSGMKSQKVDHGAPPGRGYYR